MKRIIQITAAQGPAECELATRYTYDKLQSDAAKHQIKMTCLESTASAHGYRAILLEVEAKDLSQWLSHWVGTIQWVFQSPIRHGHRRKNWFVGIQVLEVDPTKLNTESINELEAGHAVTFQSCRASGAGGQHVNTTDSAVHATHVATGIQVKVMTERSQHANKRRALELIQLKLNLMQQQAHAQNKQQRHLSHMQLERGNPVQSFHIKKHPD